MSTIRISKVLSELNIGLDTAIDFLASQKQEVEHNRNAKIDQSQYQMLTQQFATDKSSKDKAETLIQQKREEKEAILAERELTKPEVIRATATISGLKLAGKMDLATNKRGDQVPAPAKAAAPKAAPQELKVAAVAAPEVSAPAKATKPKRQKKQARVYQNFQVSPLHPLPHLRRPNPRQSHLILQLLKARRLPSQTN